MSFEKLVSFTKSVSQLSDKPFFNSPAEMKAAFDAAPDEVRSYLNKLIDALKKTESGDSGAKNIGATTISGLAGSDVQSLLESLKTYIDTADGKHQAGRIDTFSLAAGTKVEKTITYDSGKFTNTPFLTYSILNGDIYGAYRMAHSIKDNNKDKAVIHFENNGTTTQYMIVYWSATDK